MQKHSNSLKDEDDVNRRKETELTSIKLHESRQKSTAIRFSKEGQT